MHVGRIGRSAVTVVGIAVAASAGCSGPSGQEKPGVERPDGTFSKGVSAIPLKYRDRRTSGLSVNVTPETLHAVTIELPDGGAGQ